MPMCAHGFALLSQNSVQLIVVSIPIGILLQAVKDSLMQSDFSKDSINAILRELSTNFNVPYRKLMLLCRFAMTGVKVHHPRQKYYPCNRHVIV